MSIATDARVKALEHQMRELANRVLQIETQLAEKDTEVTVVRRGRPPKSETQDSL